MWCTFMLHTYCFWVPQMRTIPLGCWAMQEAGLCKPVPGMGEQCHAGTDRNKMTEKSGIVEASCRDRDGKGGIRLVFFFTLCPTWCSDTNKCWGTAMIQFNSSGTLITILIIEFPNWCWKWHASSTGGSKHGSINLILITYHSKERNHLRLASRTITKWDG